MQYMEQCNTYCLNKTPPWDKTKNDFQGNVRQLLTWVLDDYQQKVVLCTDRREEKPRDTNAVKTA